MAKNKHGFTLIEVMVVIGLLALMLSAIVPKLGGSNHKIKGVVRELAVLSREIRNNAKLKNATYRLVIEMKTDGDAHESTYWVESAGGSVLGSQVEEEEDAGKDNDDENKSPALFQPDVRIMKKPKKLPSGMYFSKVEIASSKKPFTDGRVYLYYLPQGYVEENVIQITYEDLKWTLAVQPLTGKVDIANEHIDLANLRSE
jgi:general secretion pathway protein H